MFDILLIEQQNVDSAPTHSFKDGHSQISSVLKSSSLTQRARIQVSSLLQNFLISLQL